MKSIHPEVEEQIRQVRNAIRMTAHEAALDHARQACKLATDYRDSFSYDMARLCIAIVYTAMKKPISAFPIYQEVWDSIERDAPRATIFWMYTCYCTACFTSGNMEEGFRLAYKGIDLAKEQGIDSHVMQLTYALAVEADKIGHYSMAIGLLDTVISVARRTSTNDYLIRGLTTYASIIVYTMGDKEKAQEYYREALAIAQTYNDHFTIGTILQNLASLHPDENSDEVRGIMEQALGELRQTPTYYHLTYTLCALGQWYMRAKRYPKAKELFAEALLIARKNKEEQSTLWLALTTNVHLYLEKEELNTCRTYLLEATACMYEQMPESQQYDTYYLWYRLERACHNDAEALDWLEKANQINKAIAKKKQEESVKAALSIARVNELVAQLEAEREQHIRTQKTIAQQQNTLVAVSLELEQKKHALKKIKKIAQNTLVHNDSHTKGQDSPPATTAQELHQAINDVSNDDHSWERFAENVERLHPEFTKRLLEHYPQLSPMQIRICCLLRLQLSSKEIADILKLSKKTVDNHREHIRIKLNIPRSVNLTGYILKI